MGDDPDRDAILARRTRLVAVALSGITSLAACADPAPCLSPPVREPPQQEVAPDGPTLPEETAAEPEPAAETTAAEPTAAETTAADTTAQPCLSVAVPTGPAPPRELPEPDPDDAPPRERRVVMPRPPVHPLPCLAPPHDRGSRE